MKVERVFTRTIVATTRAASAEEAAAAMRRFHVGTLLVMEQEDSAEVAGIVTDRDLVMQVMAQGLDPRRVRVDRVMAPVVASIAEDAQLDDALELMRDAGVRRLAVTKDGRVTGIVAADDIVDGLVAQFAALAAIRRNELRRETAEYDGPRAAA